MRKKSSTSGDWQEDDPWKEAKGILEGVSSLHSWIQKQTLIRPHQKMTQIRREYDYVSYHW